MARHRNWQCCCRHEVVQSKFKLLLVLVKSNDVQMENAMAGSAVGSQQPGVLSNITPNVLRMLQKILRLLSNDDPARCKRSQREKRMMKLVK